MTALDRGDWLRAPPHGGKVWSVAAFGLPWSRVSCEKASVRWAML